MAVLADRYGFVLAGLSAEETRTRGVRFFFPLRPRFWAVTPRCCEVPGPGSAAQALRLDLILRYKLGNI